MRPTGLINEKTTSNTIGIVRLLNSQVSTDMSAKAAGILCNMIPSKRAEESCFEWIADGCEISVPSRNA